MNIKVIVATHKPYKMPFSLWKRIKKDLVKCKNRDLIKNKNSNLIKFKNRDLIKNKNSNLIKFKNRDLIKNLENEKKPVTSPVNGLQSNLIKSKNRDLIRCLESDLIKDFDELSFNAKNFLKRIGSNKSGYWRIKDYVIQLAWGIGFQNNFYIRHNVRTKC